MLIRLPTCTEFSTTDCPTGMSCATATSDISSTQTAPVRFLTCRITGAGKAGEPLPVGRFPGVAGNPGWVDAADAVFLRASGLGAEASRMAPVAALRPAICPRCTRRRRPPPRRS